MLVSAAQRRRRQSNAESVCPCHRGQLDGSASRANRGITDVVVGNFGIAQDAAPVEVVESLRYKKA